MTGTREARAVLRSTGKSAEELKDYDQRIQAVKRRGTKVEKDAKMDRDDLFKVEGKITEGERIRAKREKAESRRLALADLAREFLPVVDSFERALSHASSADLESDFGQGILLIHRQLTDLWRKHGLREVDTAGGFDPNLHEAVATEESAEPANTVLEVLRKGYMIGDRLIRPALVKVAVRPDEASDENRSEEESR